MTVHSNFLDDVDPDDNHINGFYQSVNSEQLSKYFSIDSFNRTFEGTSQCLAICNYNVRSFNRNNERFFSFILCLKVKFNVVVLTETNLRLRVSVRMGDMMVTTLHVQLAVGVGYLSIVAVPYLPRPLSPICALLIIILNHASLD